MNAVNGIFNDIMRMLGVSTFVVMYVSLIVKLLANLDNKNKYNETNKIDKMKIDKINKFLLCVILIFLLFCVPLILIFISHVEPYIRILPSEESWLGFCGATIGAVIGVGGVWWQFNRTQESNKELEFSQGRPFFIVTVEKEMYSKNKYYVTDKHEYQEEIARDISEHIQCKKYRNVLKINNVSNKEMYAVKIVLEKDDDTKASFYINNIVKHSEITILDDDLKKSIRSTLKIRVYYMTELRERIKLVFENDGGEVKYLKDERKLENHKDEIDEDEYKSSGFSGNYVYHIDNIRKKSSICSFSNVFKTFRTRL